MATVVNFNGKLVKLPGVYTETKSGVNNPPADLAHGNVLIIDIDPTSKFTGGAGINGELSNGEDSIYSFDNLRNFRSFVRGGKYYELAEPLFRPFGAGNNGISQMRYIKALTTTAASSTITFTNGTFTIKSRHEGLSGNGNLVGDTAAVGTVEVTDVGASSDTINITVDETAFGGTTTVLGTFTSTGAETVTEAAEALVTAVNTNVGNLGYSASNSAGVVTISVPTDRDSDSNTVVLTSVVTGTATSAVVTFAGWIQGTVLSEGLGYVMSVSPSDSSKYIIKFYRGSFTGLSPEDSISYNGISAESSVAELIATSDSFNTIEELVEWMTVDFNFNNNFVLSASTGAGDVLTADATSYVNMTTLSGGTATHAPSDLTAVLDTIAELDYTFVIAPGEGSAYASAENAAILDHLVTTARFEKFMLVAGGEGLNEFESQSIAAAKSYNSDRVIVVHGGLDIVSQDTGTGLRSKSSAYKLALVLGRMCGLEPQTPVTLKGISMAREKHPLNKVEKEKALDNGILATYFDVDLGTFAILQGVNSLQNNRYIINADGTSHSVQLRRIAAALNKEIEVNAKVQLLGNQNSGPNRNVLSPAVVKEWLKGYLGRKTATDTVDNMILSFQDITVTVEQDCYKISYAFVPNFEINKLFFTGLVLDK